MKMTSLNELKDKVKDLYDEINVGCKINIPTIDFNYRNKMGNAAITLNDKEYHALIDLIKCYEEYFK